MKSVLYYKDRFYDHIHTVHKPTYYDILPGKRPYSVLRKRVISLIREPKELDPVNILRSQNEEIFISPHKPALFKCELRPKIKRRNVLSLDGKSYEKLIQDRNKIQDGAITDRSIRRSISPLPLRTDINKLCNIKPILPKRSQSVGRKSMKMIIKIPVEKIREEVPITSWEQSPHDMKFIYDYYNLPTVK
ncbi:unnamed protein product [Blepharisma stoltei]|uniref:Uncharacterized protein n=1 Tax=Blepharisma stoltei TaxID=1481888 RepID=A0AAU9IXN7_9CILI|nr:unnamed protein product [Blepharisma stoltei]